MEAAPQWHTARPGHTVMTMADIWLTAAARDALGKLPPGQAEAVNGAIGDITADPGQRIDLPGAPLAEPFLAKEPSHPDAPAVIYRRATPGEPGDWLVVSLMNRANYQAARRAEQELTTYPPAVREFVNAVVAGTVATATATAPRGDVTTNPAQTGGAAPTTSAASSSKESPRSGVAGPGRAATPVIRPGIGSGGRTGGFRSLADDLPAGTNRLGGRSSRPAREPGTPPPKDQPDETDPKQP